MDRVLGRFSEVTYALFRVVAGLLFACHGAQKLFGVLGGFQGQPGATAPLQSLAGAGGIIEFFGGLLIAVGLFAGPVAFLCSGEMAIGYFMMHAPQGFWPLLNRGELAVLYCFAFLHVATRGSGLWSVDSSFRGRGALGALGAMGNRAKAAL
jgi:putative oxidoreductase